MSYLTLATFINNFRISWQISNTCEQWQCFSVTVGIKHTKLSEVHEHNRNTPRKYTSINVTIKCGDTPTESRERKKRD